MRPVRRVLADRYELTDLIATGGMGQVWRARDTRLGREVAVKVLRSEYTGDETFRTRFRTEAQLTGRLQHRNIAALHDYGELLSDDGELCAYLVMELVDGEPLSALLAREPRLAPERVLDVVGQTAAALAAAHAAGVVHRDVKPGNVLLGRDGSVKITDFGIAWSAASAPLTRTGQVVGTASYLSPEQAGGGKAGPASDVYALGMVAWECLAGRRVFDGEHPVQVALRQLRDEPDPLPDDVPAPVRTLVERALVKDPAARFPDGAAFRDAVEAVRAGRALPPTPAPVTAPLQVTRPVPAGAPSPAEDGTRPLAGAPAAPRPRRGGRLLAGVATLAAGAAIGVGVLQVAGPGADPPATVTEAAPTAVEVRWADLVGRSADDVEAELVAAGLRVQRTTEATAAVVAGTVTAVGPVGRLSPAEVVTLTVAVAPAAPTTEPAEPTVLPQASEPAPETSWGPPEVPASSAPAPETSWEPTGPGNGNGNGQGNGNGNAGGNGNGRGRDG
ncbi:serine/threonine protein kinase [Geodermatophilus dictyosporus]|uniref:non-specific serine/threonine protein kinase n=1 Tax=Geodermatophilus dictyosporus TaxID=1523247 RepID=A0A1I5SDQ3_9ACTN|nr:serine/threonine protein kinase [Geodermatophilus dictyosporus]